MTATIYLSRHGQTKQNEMKVITGKHWQHGWEKIPGILDLTEFGKRQAATLGNYLGNLLLYELKRDPSGINLVTSEEKRSRKTGRIVAEIIGIPEENMRGYSSLNEQVPEEWVEDKDSGKFPVEFYQGLKPKKEVAEETKLQLESVAEEFPGSAIIAPLHSARNVCFLNSLGYDVRRFGNCGLVTLEYKRGKFSVLDEIISNETMFFELEGIETWDE